MLTKVRESEPQLNNIWDGDCLSRQKLAKDYTNLLKTIQHPYVIALDARYGSGKTFFIKRWQMELNKNHPAFLAIRFNAWETDFTNQPFIALVHCLTEELEKRMGDSTAAEEAMQTAKQVFKNLLSAASRVCSTAPIIAALATETGVGIPLATVIQAVGPVAAPLLEKGANAIQLENAPKEVTVFDNYSQQKAAISSFKAQLAEAVSLIKSLPYGEPNGNNTTDLENNERKIIIFIDELERCRPTYAIEVLELVKHLFDVDGLIFVVATDREQLAHTVGHIYGSGMDSQGYFRRFFDITLKLPQLDNTQLIDSLIQRFGLERILKNGNDIFFNYNDFRQNILIAYEMFSLTSREMEQYFAELNLLLRINDNHRVYLANLYPLLIAIKHKQPEKFKQLKSFSKNFDQVSPDNFSKIFDEIFFTNLFSKKDCEKDKYRTLIINIFIVTNFTYKAGSQRENPLLKNLIAQYHDHLEIQKLLQQVEAIFDNGRYFNVKPHAAIESICTFIDDAYTRQIV